jgi:RHS repeat-associated protein
VNLKRYRYTGMERDKESGLNYHGARYYAPWIARWVSADPIGVQGGLNQYEYAKSCPTSLVDPAGTNPKAPKNPGRQLWLAEHKNFEITPVATRTDRGITKSQRKALRGIQDAFGPKEKMDWGHPSDRTHGTTRAGASPPLRPEPMSENRRKGATVDKAAKKAAASKGGFTRDAAGVDQSVKPGTKFKQPPARPFESVMGNYESSISKRTAPVQAPRAPASAPPSTAAGRQQLELPFEKAGPPKSSPSTAPKAPSGPVTKVAGVAGGAAVVGSVIRDLHEGHTGKAAVTAGIGAGSTYVLAKVPALAPLAVMASTINAYDDNVKEHANSVGDWVENKTGVRAVGAVAASAAATGESLFQGTFGVVGRDIGEGAAAAYIRLTSDEYTLIPWKSQLWSDIFH